MATGPCVAARASRWPAGQLGLEALVGVPRVRQDVQLDRCAVRAQRGGEDQGLLVRHQVIAGARGEEERGERNPRLR